jgi:Na+-translocating ferredoxin:NAD+ oxidoreductase RnfD subunit
MDTKRMLKIWGKVVSPSIPIAFLIVLGIFCFITAGVHPGKVVWPIVGAISFALAAGGIATMLILRRQAIKKTGRWF